MENENRPVGVPPEAVALPGTGSILPYQLQVLHSFIAYQDFDNSRRLDSFRLACDNWLKNNEQRRALKLELTPKPEQPVRHTVSVAWDPEEQRAIDGGWATAWVWIRDDGLLGDPCPDLPAEPAAGLVHVGRKLAPGYYQCLPDDTAPFGTVATADDGTRVVKTAFIGGLAHYVTV